MTGLILHHSDFDGYCSAAIAKLKNPDYETISLDYGMDLEKVIPWDKVKNGNVILVDYTLEPFEYMIKLNNLAKDFTWIDHHHTSIVEANKLGLENVKGIRKNGVAACQLSWEYYFPDEKMPDTVYLIACLDIFNLIDDRIFAFNYGLESYETEPVKNFEIWKELLTSNNLFDKILSEGKAIERYVKQQDAEIAEKNCFLVDFEGFKFLALNTAKKRSLQFDAVKDKYEFDAFLTFKYANGMWNYSLYAGENQNIDLSVVAKKYGGGGHKVACGFHTSSLVLEGI
jgi:oligoribonuclease NrnB/cAMP/cGMP phosphodiesterase (DHH superfamily)